MVDPDSSVPVPPRGRRWWMPRFRVRTMLLATLAVGVPLGWYVNAARVQRRAVEAIKAAGGRVSYEWEWDFTPGGGIRTIIAGPPGPRWLVDRLGVDAVGRVTSVGLTGPRQAVPAGVDPIGAIARLDRVELLNFPGNTALTDAELGRLRGLTAVRSLSLRGTGVTGAGLVHLAGMTRLRSLTLPPGPISDADLTPLAGLRDLDLIQGEMGPGVTDAGLVHLRGLTRMKYLDLGGSRVTPAGLATLDYLDRLDGLGLKGTGIADLAPVLRSAGLKTLDVSRTPIDDAGLAAVANLKALETLKLEGTQITDAGLEHLRDLTRLRHLDLRNTKISDAGLRAMADLTNLYRLELDGTAVGDDGLAVLAPLDELSFLGIGRTRVTDAGLAHLTEMKVCSNVWIDGLNLSEAGLARVSKVRPKIRWNRKPRQPVP